MKKLFKTVCILFLAGSTFSISTWYFWYKPKLKQPGLLVNNVSKISSEEYARLKRKGSSVKKYATANHYSSKICFLADMKIASGRNRFFVYDLEKDSVLVSALVAHGSCDHSFQATANFSNKANSGCSCLGKFRVGYSYNGRFGVAYKLYGLDSSNGSAYKRNIVLHSYECVPEQETYPLPICNSRGCPMVSPGCLQKLKPYIEDAADPILLSIFNN